MLPYKIVYLNKEVNKDVRVERCRYKLFDSQHITKQGQQS